LALLFSLAACSGKKEPSAAAAAMPTPTVVVTTLEPENVPIYGEYVGQTEAVNTVEIHSQVQGFLQEIAFKEGSIVHKGQLLFLIDPRPYEAALRQAEAQLAVQQAALGDAQKTAARYKPLVKQNAISQQELDSAVATVEEDEANVQSAEASIATAKLNLSYTRITTPITGSIGVAQVRIGSLVLAGTTLLDTVYSINPMYVTFGISESDYLEYVRRGRPNRGHPPPIQLILSNGYVYAYPGTINMVAPSVNTTTGTLTIRASFPNPDNVLKPGLFSQVRFVSRVETNALVVPQAAVQQIQGTQSVYVVGPDNKIQQQTISTGPTVANVEIVTSGLKAGERVVVEGVLKVHPGMTVHTQSVPQQSVPTTLPANKNEVGAPPSSATGAASGDTSSSSTAAGEK